MLSRRSISRADILVQQLVAGGFLLSKAAWGLQFSRSQPVPISDDTQTYGPVWANPEERFQTDLRPKPVFKPVWVTPIYDSNRFPASSAEPVRDRFEPNQLQTSLGLNRFQTGLRLKPVLTPVWVKSVFDSNRFPTSSANSSRLRTGLGLNRLRTGL